MKSSVGQKFYAGEVWGSEGDGTAKVLVVHRNKNGVKFVTFISIETGKGYTISKAHFKGRFTERVK